MIVDGKGGTFVLTAQPGKSLDYRAAAAIIAKHRKPHWIEITVMGAPVDFDGQLILKATVTGERFRLAADPKAKPTGTPSPYQRLEKALEDGAKIVSVTGRVQETKTKEGEEKLPPTLIVTAFETRNG